MELVFRTGTGELSTEFVNKFVISLASPDIARAIKSQAGHPIDDIFLADGHHYAMDLIILCHEGRERVKAPTVI